MAAEVVTLYQAFCDKCGWESEPNESEVFAERDADSHNETCEDEEEPDETYQELLDRLMQNVRDSLR